MDLTITIHHKDVELSEARTIYEFLKEAAEPFPGMEIYARIVQNEPPYVVPAPEPPE